MGRGSQESVEVMQGCIQGGKSAHACALKHYSGKPQQLIKGMYALFLPDWQAAYREDQMLVINTDTYRHGQCCYPQPHPPTPPPPLAPLSFSLVMMMDDGRPRLTCVRRRVRALYVCACMHACV